MHGVSFETRRGESTATGRRNRSGKSAQLQIIAVKLDINDGQEEINGLVAALLEFDSGFDLEFTGRKNVMLNASILGLSERFDLVVAFADSGDPVNEPSSNYSSDMMTMRLAFDVVAHVDLLIVDQALVVGDAFLCRNLCATSEFFMRKAPSL